jgi:hypothetical protein
MKAAAPMTGGMSCPPVEATASTRRPHGLGNLFHQGIVSQPSTTTLATELPEIVPEKAAGNYGHLAWLTLTLQTRNGQPEEKSPVPDS